MTSILTYTESEKCEKRKENDFYPTPWDATEAAFLREQQYLSEYFEIDEPACGDGAMAEVLKSHGKIVHSSDLIYRGYGEGGVDFLNLNFKRKSKVLWTNPPFVEAEAFITLAHERGYEHIGMILKANYFNTQGRIPLFTKYRPKRIHPYSWRIDFTGDGNNHFDCIFVVWTPGDQDTTEFCIPLQKPKHFNQKLLI